MQMTITEALAAIKTTKARIEKKRAAVLPYIVRDARIVDPLVATGGSVEFVARERQAIGDLEQRIVSIRSAIQQKNCEIQLTLGNSTRSLAAWLNWRREIAEDSSAFLLKLHNTIVQTRAQGQKRQALAMQQDAQPDNVVVALDEQALTQQLEEQAMVLGDLDGKLSLLNATTTITVPD